MKGVKCVYIPKRSKSTPTSALLKPSETATRDLEDRLRRIEKAVFRNLKLGDQALESIRKRESSSSGVDSEGEEAVSASADKYSVCNTQRTDDRKRKRTCSEFTTPIPTPTSLSSASTTPRARNMSMPPLSEASPVSPRFEGHVGISSAIGGENIYLGASSPFSFISGSGAEWIDNKLGNSSFTELLRRAEAAYRDFIPIETSDEGAVYIETQQTRDLYMAEYFTHLNPTLPLFSEYFFAHPDEGRLRSPSILAASTSIVQALGAQHLSRSSPPDSVHHAAAKQHFTAASRALPNILFSRAPPCIPTVQALVGMALYYRESDNYQPVFTLLGLAASVAAQAGLHRDPRRLRITDPSEISERLGVWWVLYIFDKELALRAGRMSSIADHDADVPTPHSSHSSFLRRIMLAKTMSRVSQLLYATPDSAPHLADALNEELAAWLAETPTVSLPLPKVLDMRITHSWEETADLIRLRWSYFSTLMSVSQLPTGVGNGGLEAWARRESGDLMSVFAEVIGVRGGGTRAALMILAAAGFVGFLARICRVDNEDVGEEDQVKMLREIAECVRDTQWREGEGARVRAVFVELAGGMAELVAGL